MTNRLRDRLRRGERVLVVNPDHPSPSLVESLGALTVDAVLLDCEQGSADVETVEDMARAARVAQLSSLVRVFSGEDWVIERYLGRGVDGLVVPRLEHPDQAARVVSAVHYCAGDQKKLVVVQVETRQATESLADFLAIEGIDVFFLGPVDLAKSLGYGGEFRHPAVQAVLSDAVAAIRRAKRVAGILVDRDNAADWSRRGAQFLYTHANAFLRQGAADFVARLAAGTPLRGEPLEASAE
jgi:4-hydroxy-2-oxoheptanedioate aldolase